MQIAEDEVRHKVAAGAVTADRPALLADYLTVEEMASAAGVCARTLARWHSLRMGPPRTRLGNRVLYNIASARAWLRAQEEADVRGKERAA